MSQLKTEVKTGHHRSKKVRAHWGWQGESFSLSWGRTGTEVTGAHYKKNISFKHFLHFMLLWRVSHVCANKLCGLMWKMRLRKCVMMYQCLNVTAAMLLFRLT